MSMVNIEQGDFEEVTSVDGNALLPTSFGYNPSLAVSLARAEVDQQIATAHAFPRSITRAVNNIAALATLDEKSAADCIYAVPRGGKTMRGPSIRLAEIVFSQWGNARVGARVVHVDRIEKYVEAEGVFHDLETNSATTARVRRRIAGKGGRLFEEDMIIVTGNAACAIAKRNAIIGGVPKGVWKKGYDAVEQVMRGDIKTLAERRDAVIKVFGTIGVTAEQIFAALGIGGLDDVGLEHLLTLNAMRSALVNGEATAEEMFPKPGEAVKAATNGKSKLDQLAEAKSTPPHDPETGEIKDQAEQSADEAPAIGPVADAATGDEAPAQVLPKDAEGGAPTDTPSASGQDEAPTLLDTARSKAMEGSRPFKLWRGKLNTEDYDALRPHEKELIGAAEAADAMTKAKG